jgi:hypothetical protein
MARQTTLAEALVHRDQAWRARRGDERVAFVLPVGGRDHEQIAHGRHFAVAGFMWKDTQCGAHVQLPDDVCCTLADEGFVQIWTIVLAIVEPSCRGCGVGTRR